MGAKTKNVAELPPNVMDWVDSRFVPNRRNPVLPVAGPEVVDKLAMVGAP